jgi:hypothetical protein
MARSIASSSSRATGVATTHTRSSEVEDMTETDHNLREWTASTRHGSVRCECLHDWLDRWRHANRGTRRREIIALAKKHIKPELELPELELIWGVRESSRGVNSSASEEVLTWMWKGI